MSCSGYFSWRLSQGYTHPQTPHSPFLPLNKFYAILPHQSCQSKNSCNNNKKKTKKIKPQEFRNTEKFSIMWWREEVDPSHPLYRKPVKKNKEKETGK